MIAITSIRPFNKSDEYKTNQIRAAQSWNLFEHVYIIGQREPELEFLAGTTFLEGLDWPTIKYISILASEIGDRYVAVINSDIVVAEPLLQAERKLQELTIPCATSYRYEFDPTDPDLSKAVRYKIDRGMDIFVALPNVWKMVADRIPEDLRIGHNRWDSWVCGFFCHNFGFGFRQFTDYRCIFHPKHDGRIQPHLNTIKFDDEYFTRAHVPSPL